MKRKILASSLVMLTIFFMYLVVASRLSRQPAPYVTAKEAYALLEKRVKVPDLAYAAFDSEKMDNTGHTKKFRISGCSPSRKRTYYILANGKTLYRPRSIKTQVCKPTLHLSDFTDSPQVLQKLQMKCAHYIIYKMDWNDPRALVMCWNPEKQEAIWQALIDTRTAKILKIETQHPKKPSGYPSSNKR
jgi:hypothetical protein